MKRISGLLKSEYFSNISIQVVGTGIAQLIPFLVSPILARLFDEESFAVFAIFMAIVGVLVVPNGGRYYYAIVIPKEEVEADGLGKLSFWLTLIYNGFLLLLVVIFYEYLNQIYSLDKLWFAVPFYVFFWGVYNIFLYHSVREKSFKRNAIAKIAQTVGTAISSIILSFFGMLSSGLVFGKAIGVLISIPFFRKKLSLRIDMEQLKGVAKKYIEYPKLTILPTALDIFSLQALIFFVGKYYSEQTLGFLGLTNVILVAPLALIGYAFRDVFYQKITFFFQAGEMKKAKKLFYASATILFALGGVIALILYFFGSSIFSFIYGNNWALSGVFASILSFSMWAKLLASPLSSIFNASGRLKLLSLWQIIYFCTTIITLSLVIVFYKLNIEQVLVVYTIHEIVLYLLYFLLQQRALNTFKTVS